MPRVATRNAARLHKCFGKDTKFYSIDEFKNETSNVCEAVRREGDALVLDNGKPAFLIFSVSEDSFETILRAARQAKATIAFHEMRKLAAENGYTTDEEIEAEITAARKERRKSKTL